MATEPISISYMNRKCRICLKVHNASQLHPFFNMYFEDFSLAKIFTNITSFKIAEDEGLPKNVCSSCKTNIVNFNNMLSLFHDTETFLEKQISNFHTDNEDDDSSIHNGRNSVADNIEDEGFSHSDLDADDFKIQEVVDPKVDKAITQNGNITENTKMLSIDGECESITSFKYSCECGDCFLYKSGFRQHMQIRHDRLLEETDFDSYSEEIKLKIPVGFPNNIEYVSSKVTIRKNMLQCRICGTSFSSEQEVKKHEEIHKTYICDHCGSAFLKKNYLADHLRIHSEERRYTCNICQKSFKHRYTFRVHKISHDVTRDFVCDTCGAGFKTRGTLRTHMRIKHSNIRNYPCSNCNLRFNLKSTLDKHFLRKHTADRKKNFVCTKCGAAYLNKNTLTRHVTEKHLGMAKFHPCTICDNKMYVMKKGLRAHMLKKHGIVYQ